MKKYSILVNSCDSYSDAWPMFFYLLRENWKGELPEVFLNTETKKYNPKDYSIITLNQLEPDIIPWGKRLKDSLRRIESDYVLMMLEDFYYEQPIDIAKVDFCLSIMESNNNISHIQLINASETCNPNYQSEELFEGMVLRKKYGQFTMIAGPTLWRKSDLLNLTKETDTPWDWEYFGSKRTWLYGKKIFGWKKQKTNPIFDYDYMHGGAIHRGAWVGYKMHELENKFNFKLDYGKRKIVDDWMKDSKTTSILPPYKRIGSIIQNRYKSVKNIFYGLYLSYSK